MSEVTARFLAAKAIIRNQEEQFLILREGGLYEEGTNIGKWDVPSGRLEVEESLLDGLHREVREETGLAVLVGDLLDARENFPVIKGKKVHIVRLYYLCESSTSEVILSTDHDKFAWITKSELADYPVMVDAAELINSL